MVISAQNFLAADEMESKLPEDENWNEAQNSYDLEVAFGKRQVIII